MCGLSLAWVTSENSTSTGMPTSFDSIFFAGPHLVSYCLRSPVLTAPVRGSTPTLFARLSAVQRQPLSSGSPVNSHSRPRTTSGHGEISGPRILCLVSRQNRQRNRLPWRETHIVLHSYIHLMLSTVTYRRVSTQCNGYSDGLRNRSTRVRTPVALLRSLSGKYPWERYEPPYLPSYGLNSTTTEEVFSWCNG